MVRYASEDNHVIGTAYGHNDTSYEIEALRHLRDSEAIDPGVIDKILGPNAETLYGP